MQTHTIHTVARIDPFYAYLDLTEQFGRGQAFLLDAAKDAPSMYRMSVIGVLPVLQVSAKDGEVALTCSAGLMRYLRERCSLLTARDTFIEREQATVRMHVSDPMFLLEQLRRPLHRLTGAATEPFAQGFLGTSVTTLCTTSSVCQKQRMMTGIYRISVCSGIWQRCTLKMKQ